MVLPFKENTTFYQPEIWPELSVHLKEQHILVYSESKLHTLGSAILGGGMGSSSYFVNLHVSKDFDSTIPEKSLENSVHEYGYPVKETVGLMTAAYLSFASVQEETNDHFGLFVCTTSGVGNAARAGLDRTVYSSYRSGTINIMIFVQGSMTASAMLEGIMAATEAKAAALQDMSIKDSETNLIATGTTSDAMVIACDPRYYRGIIHQHAGTATVIGNAMGRLVYRSVIESVSSLDLTHRTIE
ncbi:Adenosylcobinamide amidohydrolase [Paenibacillus sp. 1_12]|uniref:adenosylcobinamide amidohydrolase n=1 Tax=Paenibacillus sp. 1_12 TaxID=1566278 RepID=UPI0008DF1EF1|nr:adenosylcobinamide amidohydrolase [Paenibacillus sp. 1_12]SFK95410.1 Adenosylcobinamide amidohydrolase [Paenibacillus sp. 1_12]